jgi:hypothetical protein
MDLKKANMVAGSVSGTRNTSPVMGPSSANSLLTWRPGLIHSGQQTFTNSPVLEFFEQWRLRKRVGIGPSTLIILGS